MVLRREEWQLTPANLHLGRDEIHVWRASLERDANEVKMFWATLALEERRKAESYHFDRDRLHYVVGRGMLRTILGRYLETPPSEIYLTYNDYGKPALAEDRGGLRFNVSHSHGAALYACTRERELGVDIEMLLDDFASLVIAERFFSGTELCELRTLPAGVRTQAFFNCWTRKEAYIKAIGSGLSHPLNGFAVSLTPGESARLISSDVGPREATEWSIINLDPFPGFAAALAIRDRSPKLQFWEWQ